MSAQKDLEICGLILCIFFFYFEISGVMQVQMNKKWIGLKNLPNKEQHAQVQSSQVTACMAKSICSKARSIGILAISLALYP